MSLLARIAHLRLGITDETVLNGVDSSTDHGASPPPQELASTLSALKKLSKTRSGADLDLSAVLQSDEYLSYRALTRRLPKFDPGKLDRTEEKLAFWINLYNGLMIDAVIQWRIQRSVKEITGFFWRAAYDVGGLRFSANSIEHGILRANAPHPSFPGAAFGLTDPRRRYAIDRLDPRVHFTLVCASRSCPPISVYEAPRIDKQLDQATRAFLQGGGFELDTARGRILLSRLFQWYSPDFGGNWMAIGDKSALLAFVLSYLPPQEADKLQGDGWSVSFMDYDWRLYGQWS